jgi:hypothetical protein
VNPLVVDNSRLSTFRLCHEKSRLRSELNLVPKKDQFKPETKRSFGTAFHAALDTWYRTESIDQAESAFFAIAREAGLPISTEDNPDEPRTIERGIALFHAYLKRWENEPFKLLRHKDGTPYTELRFSFHLFDYNDRPVYYTGKIDKVVEAGGRVYMPDIKTTRRSLSSFQNSIRPNHQLTGYYIGLKSLGIDVAFVGYDAIFISTRMPNPKKGGWWTNGIDIEKDFLRVWSTRSETDVQRFMETTIATTKELIKHQEEGITEPWCLAAPDACWRFGKCEYIDVCTHNHDPHILETFFEKDVWHVTADTLKEATEEEERE